MDLTDDEVRLLIDVCKGEEMRLHRLRQEEPDGTYPGQQDSWFEKRVDAVAAIKDRLKGERFPWPKPPEKLVPVEDCCAYGCCETDY